MYKIIFLFLFVFLIDNAYSQVAQCERQIPQNCREHFQNLNRVVKIGDIIIICVKTIPNAKKFTLNLQESLDVDQNIPLHFSLQFDESIFLRNSKINGKWSTAERTNNLYPNVNPIARITPGESFTLQIIFGEVNYLISVNGKEFAKFEHRMQISKIHAIAAYYDLDRISNVEHISTFPAISSHCTLCGDNALLMDLAYVTHFPNKLIPGTVIAITGQASGNAGEFALQFIESITGRELFRFNPRFSENILVRNSQNIMLSWLADERNGTFPFTMNQEFKLAIGIFGNEFKYAVNGYEFGTYEYRDINLLYKVDKFAIIVQKNLNLSISKVDIINTEIIRLGSFALYSELPEIEHEVTIEEDK